MTFVIAALALLFLLVSAVLTTGETAAFSVGSSRLGTLREEGFEGSEALHALRSRSGPVRGSVTLLTTFLDLSAVGLAVVAAAPATPWILALTLAASVSVVVLVSGVVPRAIADRYPIRIALSSAPVLELIERWATLLLAPLLRLEDTLAGRGGPEDTTEDQREFLEMSELGQREGVVDRDEHLLVQRAFRLDELTAFDVMTPRVDVFAWPERARLADVVPQLREIPYSRVPVYGESIDDVTGILYVREAYESYIAQMGDARLSEVCRDPFFVPGSLSLTQLLRDFQARRIHMGVVADEYGGTDGIVTLEDVLEELVGEIVDETDVEDEPVQRLGRNELVADGGVDLREINYVFNVSLPQLEHRSLNGYILEELGHVPSVGERMERSGVQIEVVEATDTQVVRARLRRVGERGGGAEEGGA